MTFWLRSKAEWATSCAFARPMIREKAQGKSAPEVPCYSRRSVPRQGKI
ncbi:hypothetical protein [Porphyromonas gingivicanis]|nr:hypothetical protein [Porphyromonas gingivicanis]